MPTEPEHKSNREVQTQNTFVFYFFKQELEQPYQGLEKNPEFEYKDTKISKGKKV